jgi:hypothetical protein
MRSLPLMHTEYWNLSTNTVRSGATARGESLTDVDNYLLPQAQVHAARQLDAPWQSSDNWLAWNQVTDEEYRRAAERLSREDVTAIGVRGPGRIWLADRWH